MVLDGLQLEFDSPGSYWLASKRPVLAKRIVAKASHVRVSSESVNFTATLTDFSKPLSPFRISIHLRVSMWIVTRF